MGQPISAAYALLPMPVLAVLFAGIWYRSGYAFSEHWMAHRQGLLGCRYTYVPFTKVQMMDLTQGPLLRLHDASTLLVYNGADVQRFEFISSAVLMSAKARISALVAQSRVRWM
jgi:membrane protein YdbS with pleckstrin-like domain